MSELRNLIMATEMGESPGSASTSCPCVDDTTSSESLMTPHCMCPRDHHDIVVHLPECLMYKNEKMLYTQVILSAK